MPEVSTIEVIEISLKQPDVIEIVLSGVRVPTTSTDIAITFFDENKVDYVSEDMVAYGSQIYYCLQDFDGVNYTPEDENYWEALSTVDPETVTNILQRLSELEVHVDNLQPIEVELNGLVSVVHVEHNKGRKVFACFTDHNNLVGSITVEQNDLNNATIYSVYPLVGVLTII